ncbi:hypothetical protein PoB_003183400 [Plakobranchus ocellatus]|uniref:Uncharacterized protein n=1 Tax=Plakobranchus ocellatus TaxID=259542 RepID=A0AAV4ACG3_9GAST|nr:hypothetical protein PoB_003183400 [Plakobranchus ocellatus]
MFTVSSSLDCDPTEGPCSRTFLSTGALVHSQCRIQAVLYVGDIRPAGPRSGAGNESITKFLRRFPSEMLNPTSAAQ